MDNFKPILLIVLGIICVSIYFVIDNPQLYSDDCCICGAGGGCCPCPNEKYFENVSEWYGSSPSGAGSWAYMCESYQKEFNKSFYCFE